jgi:hypothetical protein
LLRLLGFGGGLKVEPIFGFIDFDLALGDAHEYLGCHTLVHKQLGLQLEVQKSHHGKANEQGKFQLGYGYHSASPRVCFWLVFFSVVGALLAVTY